MHFSLLSSHASKTVCAKRISFFYPQLLYVKHRIWRHYYRPGQPYLLTCQLHKRRPLYCSAMKATTVKRILNIYSKYFQSKRSVNKVRKVFPPTYKNLSIRIVSSGRDLGLSVTKHNKCQSFSLSYETPFSTKI